MLRRKGGAFVGFRFLIFERKDEGKPVFFGCCLLQQNREQGSFVLVEMTRMRVAASSFFIALAGQMRPWEDLMGYDHGGDAETMAEIKRRPETAVCSGLW